ncbi:hypothetical protein NUW54_g13249 [Trametes sanguinea]|uniref:Uncharacterized protein n=1 Tax=Trametes sanguinea TaxID=158606 RepID=A0ACC1MMU8_9APHY|nr:hypothetical protein NUW54_g13249 [Trametes sanguinea]
MSGARRPPPNASSSSRRHTKVGTRLFSAHDAYPYPVHPVLSDPVTRRAYDILGPEGLLLLQSADLRHVAEEEFEEELRRQQRELDRLRVEQAIHPKGNITVGLDASPFFDYEYETEDGSPLSPWQHLHASLGDVRRDTFSVRHRVQAQIRDKTWFVMTGRVTTGSKPPPERGAYMRSVLMGTVKHQFSPRLDFEATTNMLALSNWYTPAPVPAALHVQERRCAPDPRAERLAGTATVPEVAHAGRAGSRDDIHGPEDLRCSCLVDIP